jgi:LysM repeat protein
LQYANPQALRNEGVLLVRDHLLVPTALTFTVGAEGVYYTVQPGDAWASIADKFGIPLQLLQAVNTELVRPAFLLRPGDEIYVPSDLSSSIEQ